MGFPAFSSDLVRSSADLVLLALLAEEPMHGYQLLTSLGEKGSGDFRLAQGTLYPLLYRLEREGWVGARWETPPRGKRRKVYSLTAAGRKELQRQRAEWTRFTAAIRSILEECDRA